MLYYLKKPNRQNSCELLYPKQSEFDSLLLCWIFVYDLGQTMLAVPEVERGYEQLLLCYCWSTASKPYNSFCVWDQGHWNSLSPKIFCMKGLSVLLTVTMPFWVGKSTRTLQAICLLMVWRKMYAGFDQTHLFCEWTRIPGLSITCLLKNHKIFSSFKTIWKNIHKLTLLFP